MMKNWIWIVSLSLTLGSMMSHAIEEPSWTLTAELDNVEIRQYEPVIQARASMADKSRSSSGFRTLAGYIFGGNSQEKSIAMTAPVEETLADEDGYMAFTMPSEYSLEDLPEPDDSLVTLHPVPSRTMAVVQFSGWARNSVVEKQTRVLLDTIEAHGWIPVGTPSLNQYNPPWTPPWSRRNEVMVQVRAE